MPFEEDKSNALMSDTSTLIDDPELLTTKKYLTAKFSPLGMIKALQDKHKSLSF